jgi:hypothetical protein
LSPAPGFGILLAPPPILQLISIGLRFLEILLTWQPQLQQHPSSVAMTDSGTNAVLEWRDDEVQLNSIVDNHEVANECLWRGE